MDVLHHVNQGLRAHTLFTRDVDYVVKDGRSSSSTSSPGRLMPGRRWSDGLHQAVEAKEKVKIERENQTLATITLQNYFRMYGKLCGMTGTAETEAPEFEKIYKLEVLVTPTNRPLIRVENPDVVYRTEPEKYGAVVREIKELRQRAGPSWSAPSPSRSPSASRRLLKRDGIKHVVLNAKYHEREAEIVAQAGRFGAVTIATNMAGRGTDIILGGVPDLRAKALLVGKQLDPNHATADERQGAAAQVPVGDGGGVQDGAAQRKFDPKYGEPRPRYLGLVASFPPDHPSFQSVRALAPEGEPLAAYLDAARALPRPTRTRSPSRSSRRSRSRWTSSRSIPSRPSSRP